MVELIIDLNFLIALTVGFAGFMTFILRWTKSPKFLQQRIKDKDTELADWKHKFSVIKGQYYKMVNTKIVSKEDAARLRENPQNVEDLIPSILNSAAPHLPKILSDLAKNSNIQGWITKLAHEHPDEAQQFLSNMLPKITSLPKGPVQPKGL